MIESPVVDQFAKLICRNISDPMIELIRKVVLIMRSDLSAWNFVGPCHKRSCYEYLRWKQQKIYLFFDNIAVVRSLINSSKAFIEQNIQLISQETIDYLKSWAIELETENVKFVFYLKLHKRIKLFVDIYCNGTCSSSNNYNYSHSPINSPNKIKPVGINSIVIWQV